MAVTQGLLEKKANAIRKQLTDKPDPEFVKKWVKALRSGEYKQGQRFLRVDERGQSFYCCIGVACELVDMPADHRASAADRILWRYGYGIDTSPSMPFGECLRLFGFEEGEGLHGLNFLAGLNDEGWTFDDLADLIEEVYL